MVQVKLGQMSYLSIRIHHTPTQVHKKSVNSLLNRSLHLPFVCPGETWTREPISNILHLSKHSLNSKDLLTLIALLMVANGISVRLAKIIFANLFYYSAYICYYSWISLHFLVLLMGPTVLFYPTLIFIYSTFSKKFSVLAKLANLKQTLNWSRSRSLESRKRHSWMHTK